MIPQINNNSSSSNKKERMKIISFSNNNKKRKNYNYKINTTNNKINNKLISVVKIPTIYRIMKLIKIMSLILTNYLKGPRKHI